MNVGFINIAQCSASDCENNATIRAENLYGKDNPKTEELCGECFSTCLTEHTKSFSAFRISSAINIKDGSEIEIPAKPPLKMKSSRGIIGATFWPEGSESCILWDCYTHKMLFGINKPGGSMRPIMNPEFESAPNEKTAKALAEKFFKTGM